MLLIQIYAKALCEGPDTPNYRLLCHNCNNAKSIYKYCPHERSVERLGPSLERKIGV